MTDTLPKTPGPTSKSDRGRRPAQPPAPPPPGYRGGLTQDRLHELFDDAPVGYVTVQANGLIREANRTFGQMVSREPSALCNVPFTHLLDADDVGSFYVHRAGVLNSRSSRARLCEVRLLTADGRRIWVQLASSVTQSDDPRQREWRIMVTDMSQRKQGQDQANRRKETLNAVFDNTPLLIAAVDPSGFVELVNRQWERTLGWTAHDMRADRAWPRLFPYGPMREAARDFIRRATGRWADFRVTTRFESVIDLRCAVASLAGDGRLIIAQNVTEELRTEEAVRERQESLRRVAGLNTVSEMAAAISHEINQPLTALINYATGAAYRLRAIPGLPREALEATENAVIEAHRAANILRHIRALVAKRRIEQASLDINELLQRLARDLSEVTTRGNAVLQVVCQADLPAVLGDRVQLEQVIVNLVRNAIDAMEGTIHPLREVLVCAQLTEGPAILVSVVDRGHGISPAVKQNLFTPFFTTKAYGTGIGLSLCLSIVEAHGGRLWADHNPEGGAIFRFTLPLSDVPRPSRVARDAILPAACEPEVIEPLREGPLGK